MKIIKVLENTELPARIIIAGSRSFDDYDALKYMVDATLNILDIDKATSEIVSGGAIGADLLGEKYALESDIYVARFPAQWKKYGRSAGVIRNNEMLDYANKEGYNGILIAFWDGVSRGTKHIITRGKSIGLTVKVFNYSVDDNAVLSEGVSKEGGTFRFDFNKDAENEIIPLTHPSVYQSKFHGNIYHYGYRFNKGVPNSDSKDFLKFVKSNATTDNNLKLMINNCVEKLCEKVSGINFGGIVKIPSSSPLNAEVGDLIANKLGVKNSITLTKKLSYDVEVDYDKLKSSYHGDDYDAFKKVVDADVERGRNGKFFNIKAVTPKYRRYLVQLFNAGDVNFDLGNTNDLLLIDDIKTTGESIKYAISLIRGIGYGGNIHIFTLINNR